MGSDNSVVWCKLPNAGLGNQLFPLMKADIFASLNNLPLVITNYHQLKVGPYIRREKTKRRYKNYFNFEKSVIREWLDKKKVNPENFLQFVKEPLLKKMDHVDNGTLFQFNKTQHPDYFEGLREHRKQVKDSFYHLVRPEIIGQVDARPIPKIGVHIRRGDFMRIENKEKGPTARTPESYFVDVINKIREVAGMMSVSVFSDGYSHEFEDLFKLPDVHLVEGNKDIVDMLLLSKSKIIIASPESTFSYWSGFLSDAPIVLHPQYLRTKIRDAESGKHLFEGSLENFLNRHLNMIY